ncbi:PDR/VanB family oxidoreductase [Castellaniella sp. S9]|uniref:PDR/VanB family oxidoreductase n=1 Tax=Castellaniella sp. S9 TaxID=2993652 RepID=UPI0022B4E3F1|nr:PDR/VanB family oxidoreductase [Castellaniella sp. S9]
MKATPSDSDTAPAAPQPLYVRIDRIRQETELIRSYRLVALNGGELPAYEAGAHVGVVLPDGKTRYYSLCGDPDDRRQYLIGVQREDKGRGGSRLLHASAREGRFLKLVPARNHFPLADGDNHLLIAGGIGITPILAMAASLQARGIDYRLLYFVRTEQDVAFRDLLEPFLASGRGQVISFSDPSDAPPLAELLGAPRPGRHAYFCGSPGFMDWIESHLQDWDPAQVHKENFHPATARPGDKPLTVTAARRQLDISVPADESILHALRDAAVLIDSVCENGTCGTCRVAYLSGRPEHRDSVLTPEERRQYVITCVSRADPGEPLVLDI